LLVVELLTVELLVTGLLLVTLVLLDGVAGVDGVEGADGVLVELQLAVLKLFTACQSRMCRLPGQAATLCGWLLPGP